LILPLLDIYRRYYGSRVALYLLGTLYLTMAAAGYLVELLSGAAGIIPSHRAVGVISQGPSPAYTSALNVIFLAIAAALVVRFVRSGGPEMLAMMDMPEEEMAAHEHHCAPASP